MNVFVHLWHGAGVETWRQRFETGTLIGINEPDPYGYDRAEADGCRVSHSVDHPEGRVTRYIRVLARHLLGFDLIHAWRNRHAALAADAVWTHTEFEHLALGALFRILRPSRRPRLIAQSIWLFDRWDRLWAPTRGLYRWLLAHADVLTVHSPENHAVLQRVFPGRRSALVLFGINADAMRPPRSRDHGGPLRLAAIGNDRHRDWTTLIRAVRGRDDVVLRIVTRRLARGPVGGAPNVEVIHLDQNHELHALYDWADVAVVPLKANLHASGITVVQEAVVSGVPVVVSRTGGLEAYFGEDEVAYVPPGDPEALRDIVLELGRDLRRRVAMAARAQERIRHGGLDSRQFVARHVALTRELACAREAPASPGRLSPDRARG